MPVPPSSKRGPSLDSRVTGLSEYLGANDGACTEAIID